MADYSDHPITKMTMEYLASISDPDEHVSISNRLFVALGCPVSGPGRNSSEIVWANDNQDRSEVLEQNLLTLFSAVAGEIVEKKETIDLGQLLCGMERSHCWRSLIGSKDGAYLFAAGLIGYVEYYVQTYRMDIATAPRICLMLNEWLKPAVKWEQPPSIGTLCEHMFGSVWPTIVLPDDQWRPMGATYDAECVTTEFMMRDRPRFLPGLCLAQDQDRTMVSDNLDLPAELGL
jgi:hypothetical protein